MEGGRRRGNGVSSAVLGVLVRGDLAEVGRMWWWGQGVGVGRGCSFVETGIGIGILGCELRGLGRELVEEVSRRVFYPLPREPGARIHYLGLGKGSNRTLD